MTLSDIEETRKAASAAFKRHDYDLALSLSIELSRYNFPEALFNCGLIYESGAWGQVYNRSILVKAGLDFDDGQTDPDRIR